MRRLEESLHGCATRLANELSMPLVVTLSVLDLLEDHGDQLTDSEKMQHLNLLQISLNEITQSLNNAINDFSAE